MHSIHEPQFFALAINRALLEPLLDLSRVCISEADSHHKAVDLVLVIERDFASNTIICLPIALQSISPHLFHCWGKKTRFVQGLLDGFARAHLTAAVQHLAMVRCSHSEACHSPPAQVFHQF
jgi:hypothetical protein